jgi:hypothetical protein
LGNNHIPESSKREKLAAKQGKDWEKFTTAVELWQDELRDAMDELDEQVNVEERRAEYRKRDELIKASREEEARQEAERSQNQMKQFIEYTKQMANRTPPLQRKWKLACKMESVHQSSQHLEAEFRDEDEDEDEPPLRPRFWHTEEKKWLLNQMRKEAAERMKYGESPRPTPEDFEEYAKCIQCPYYEVEQEAEILRQAVIRASRENKIPVEAWAR